jgi:hypothetical protein
MEQIAPAEMLQTRDLAATKPQVWTGEGTLMGIQVCNNQAAAVFIQLFDALAANVTLATTNPSWEFSVPASTSTTTVALPPCGLKLRIGLVAASTTTEKGLTGSAAGVQVFYAIQ